MKTIRFTITLWLCCLLVQAQTPTNHGPLKVSDNQRYIVHQDGTPFFWLGDTAWELFHRLNREEANTLLQERTYSLTLTILLVGVGATIAFPQTFPTFGNWSQLLLNLSSDTIVAVGMVILLIAGVFDLSVGSVVAFAGGLAAYGMIQLGWPVAVAIGTALPTAGRGLELRVITAVILGGAGLSGGHGKVLGALLGAVFMGLVGNVMVLARVSGYWQEIILGLILITAVWTDMALKKRLR